MAMRFFSWKPTIEQQRGSVLPFLAVLMLLLTLAAFFSLGATKLYLDRSLVRDALDAGAAAALAPAKVIQKRYHFGTHWVSGGCEDCDPICVPFENTRPVISRVTPEEAEALARQYFHANMAAHGLAYELLDFKLKILYENRMMDVYYETCEGDYDQWQENFPRWARVSVEARVKMPVQLGQAMEVTEVVTTFKSEYKRKI